MMVATDAAINEKLSQGWDGSRPLNHSVCWDQK
jgi:hypothetical protein